MATFLKTILFGFLGIIIILMVIGSIGGDTKNYCTDSVTAYPYSWQFIRERLKSPSSAEFPSSNVASITYLGDCRHLIVAHVDAKNAFGVMLRNYFTTIMEYRQSSQNWYNIPSATYIAESEQEVRQVANVLRAKFLVPKLAKNKKNLTQKKLGNASVLQFQRLLKTLGYDPGPTDGIYGAKTRSAIISFEQEQGLPQNGKPSDELLERLLKKEGSSNPNLQSKKKHLPKPKPDQLTSIFRQVEKLKDQPLSTPQDPDANAPEKGQAQSRVDAFVELSVYDLTLEQRRELSVFGIRGAFGLQIGPSDIKEVHSGGDLEELIASGLNGNGHLCAKIISVHALDLAGAYEVTCTAYRGGSGQKTYMIDALKGVAFEQ